MSKFYGKIGFAKQVVSAPGIHKEEYDEYPYRGDINRNTRTLQSGDQVNDDIIVANELSIVADPYARNNFHAIRYAWFMGARWKVTRVEVQYPRLTLTLGGVFNG